MNLTPRVAAVHDMSGLGRCSLTVALTVLSAMGAQCCPLPTAVLSAHTAFPASHLATFLDLTDEMERMLLHWRKLHVSFDAIYSGFLGSEQQIGILHRLLSEFRRKETLVLVDPVMGDHGKVYRTYTPEMCRLMGELAAGADLITPNLTEACILADGDYASVARAQSLEPVWELAERLAGMGPRTVIVTGVHRGDLICNAGFDARTGRRFSVGNRSVGSGRSFSGTGDLLASVLCGGLVRGETAEAALEKAARLLEAAISDAEADGTDPNEGVPFENHLDLLIGKEG